MAKINLSTLHSSAPTARGYLWDVVISGLGALDDADINLRCTTATQPTPEIPLIVAPVQGWDIKQLGKVTWNDVTFTCVETVDYKIYKALMDYVWKNAGGSYEGTQDSTYASPQLGANSVGILLEGLDRSPVVKWRLAGCVIHGEIGFAELSPDHDGVQELTFTVGYQHAVFK